MTAYIARRLLLVVPTLLLIVTVVFFVMRSLPGDPVIALLGDDASEEAIRSLRARWGLDKPLGTQYIEYLWGLVSRGDLGYSYHTRTDVSDIIAYTLPYSLLLAGMGMIIAAGLGIPLGLVCAFHRNSLLDHFGRIISLLGLSIPAFYLGVLLMIGGSLTLGWFPMLGGGDFADPAGLLHHAFLPALAIGLTNMAVIMRTTRSEALNILNQDFTRTARSKGLSELTVQYKHVLRNCLIPVVMIIAIYIGVTLGAVVLTETVFARPGVGRVLVGAAKSRDYSLVQGAILVLAVFVTFANLVADLLCAVIDPRVRYS